MRWRLIIEEYSPNLIYIKGQNNVAADALSRLALLQHFNKLENDPIKLNPDNNAELFSFGPNDLPSEAFPITLRTISAHQQKDKSLLNLLKSSDDHQIKKFHGGELTEAHMPKR